MFHTVFFVRSVAADWILNECYLYKYYCCFTYRIDKFWMIFATSRIHSKKLIGLHLKMKEKTFHEKKKQTTNS